MRILLLYSRYFTGTICENVFVSLSFKSLLTENLLNLNSLSDPIFHTITKCGRKTNALPFIVWMR